MHSDGVDIPFWAVLLSVVPQSYINAVPRSIYITIDEEADSDLSVCRSGQVAYNWYAHVQHLESENPI